MTNQGTIIVQNGPQITPKPAPVPGSVVPKYIVAVLLYSLLFSLWQIEPVPWRSHWASILVAMVGFVPLTRWYVQGAKGLPVFELICLSYVLQFSLPVYLQPNQIVIHGRTIQLPWTETFETLLLVALGIGSMVAGYYIFKSSPFAPNLPHLDLPLNPKYRSQYILLGVLVGLGVTYAQRLNVPLLGLGRLHAIFRLAANQFNIAVILLAYRVYNEENDHTGETVFLYLTVAFAVGLGLASGLLENTLIPIALLLTVRWHVTRKLPLRLLIIGLVLFVSLHSVKIEFRNRVRFEPAYSGPIGRTRLWVDMGVQSAQDVVDGDLWRNTQDLVYHGASRLDLLHKFVWVRQMTPKIVPYYNGATYTYFLYGWIPRILWPDKPLPSKVNDRFDADYRLLYDWQTANATKGIGQLPETYANFGVWGVIVIMFLQGVVFGLLERWLNSPQSEGGRAIYLSLVVFFLNGIGSATAVLFGALLQHVLVNALILRPFSTSWEADSNKEPQ